MKMIITRREFYCPVCNGIKTLEPTEVITVCPFCGIGDNGKQSKFFPKNWTTKKKME